MVADRPQWALERAVGLPIVGKVDHAPAPQRLEPKERRKARIGEPFRFALDVLVEPTGPFSKRAFVSSPMPGGATFEIFCDEGKTLGSDEAAPSPLAYFTAGVAFCLLTHITGFLRHTDIELRSIRIEMRANYWTKLGHVDKGGQGEGGCDSYETYVIVDSDEPAERLQALLAVCEEACIASQTIAKAVPKTVTLVVNGQAV